MNDKMKPDALLPCPFCGSSEGLDIREASTFRWRIGECKGCGATTGEERIQTTGEGTQEQWEANCAQRICEVWNRRSLSHPAIQGLETAAKEIAHEMRTFRRVNENEIGDWAARLNAALAQLAAERKETQT